MNDSAPPAALGPGYLRDPHPCNAALREDGPVHEVRLPTGLKVWVVTGHAAARAALADPRLSKDMRHTRELFDRHMDQPVKRRGSGPSLAVNMLGSDPPDHTRLRRPVARAFTARRVAALRPRVEEVARRLLTDMAPRREANLLEAYAYPLSITVIGELLGVPERDHGDFQAWARTLLDQSAGDREQARRAAAAMADYLTALVAAKRAAPGEDLLTALVEAEGEQELDEEELVSTAFLLLLAGFETTVNLIGNGMFALLTDPAQHAALREDPSRIPDAVEEFLRFEGPANLASYRYTTAPVDIAGTAVPAGEFVLVSLSAANRDPARFPAPDRLDLARDASGHLAFGHGIHRCLGAPLARLEGEIAFRELLCRFPDIRLAVPPEQVTWQPSTLVRAVEALPVAWGEAR
ncbi:cytochrome P450 [Streptomyces sp. UNOC14_S4]|uniref:cytochrome P450 family protein n=1 Tax=Streptomyces sp. UNOC14_S4 TaxID=2872340 RepID=UPI001E5948E0|nr:cytochrome P450 [Streptomyces sp. UNOC14_S4]MCC3768802.1 cytochrome P450 [Streptomyces sp. UNOC14_S4]